VRLAFPFLPLGLQCHSSVARPLPGDAGQMPECQLTRVLSDGPISTTLNATATSNHCTLNTKHLKTDENLDAGCRKGLRQLAATAAGL